MKVTLNRPSHRFWWRSLALASMLWLGLSGGATPVTETSEETASAEIQQKRTAAYVFDRPGLVFEDRDAANLEQLNFSFGLIKNGEVNGDHWRSIDQFKAFIARHPHILPVLSIGGWGADGFSQAAATEEGRARFVDSTLVLMQKHGFLGVDIDWEYPGSAAAGIAADPADRENYTLLLKALREGLDRLTADDGKPRLLATAIGALPALIENIDCKAVGEVVDQINLMTYDLQTAKVASHHTALYGDARYPLSADHAVKAFTEAGIPKEKIMIGVAFYGRRFTLAEKTDAPVFAPATDIGADTLSYAKVLVLAKRAPALFDENAKAPYVFDGQSFVTYDDPVSIGHKGDYVLQNDLMGLMCWEYGGDPSGELLSAMHDSLNN